MQLILYSVYGTSNVLWDSRTAGMAELEQWLAFIANLLARGRSRETGGVELLLDNGKRFELSLSGASKMLFF